jgi:beta-lysine 5,6-aminomutase beta subunit
VSLHQPELIRAYGDRRDDGVVQLSFTLPVPLSAKAKEAAVQFCRALGLRDVKVAAAERAADHYTFFIVYARADVALDYSAIHAPEVLGRKLDFEALNALISSTLGRRVVVLGACTGTDTHTVGIDAILNMKGYAGDYGLERYPMFDVYNLGSQVPNEELVRRALQQRADAVLVSQVVTQRDVHKDNSRHFIEAARRAGLSQKAILLLGGPRVDHGLATELGFDAGFGPGTKPSDVANYVVQELLRREGHRFPGGTG